MAPFCGFEGVAHTYFVLDFQDEPPVPASVESRRERGAHLARSPASARARGARKPRCRGERFTAHSSARGRRPMG